MCLRLAYGVTNVHTEPMTPTRRTVATICAAILATAATYGTVLPMISATMHGSSETSDCQPYLYGTSIGRPITGDVPSDWSESEAWDALADWDAHLQSGWHGRQGDGMEALYAPHCD